MCYKMLYEINVSATVKPKEIKTVEMNHKLLTKKEYYVVIPWNKNDSYES